MLEVDEENVISFRLQDCNCTRKLSLPHSFQPSSQQLSMFGSQGMLNTA